MLEFFVYFREAIKLRYLEVGTWYIVVCLSGVVQI